MSATIKAEDAERMAAAMSDAKAQIAAVVAEINRHIDNATAIERIKRLTDPLAFGCQCPERIVRQVWSIVEGLER